MSRSMVFASAAVCAAIGLGVVPGFAAAAPELTFPTGTRLAIGSALKGTNIGESLFSDGKGNVLFACSKSTFAGELTKNNGKEVEATITSFELSGTAEAHHLTEPFWCTAPLAPTYGARPVFGVSSFCLRATAAMASDEFQIRGGKCSEGSKELSFFLLGPECAYGRTEALKGTFTTDAGASASDAILHLKGQSFAWKSGLNLLCPSEYRWEISFTVETGKTVTEPSYFS